jgi:hypothetical protein
VEEGEPEGGEGEHALAPLDLLAKLDGKERRAGVEDLVSVPPIARKGVEQAARSLRSVRHAHGRPTCGRSAGPR